MKAWLFLIILTACHADGSPQLASSLPAIAQAVSRSLPLLQASADTWNREVLCTSCHHAALGVIAVKAARDRGFRVDVRSLEQQVDRMRENLTDYRDEMMLGIGPTDGQTTLGYSVLALAVAGEPTSSALRTTVHYLAGKQAIDGRWRPEARRPPIEGSEFTATALDLRALELYPMRNRAADLSRRFERARAWLTSASPDDHEDRVMQLLGLVWARADPAVIRARADELLAEQRADGGWAQLRTRASDSLATGNAVVVLQASGRLRVDDPAYHRATDYLLRTQLQDGSWHVDTRRRDKGLPYFETGFPHGEDQFVSYAATTWAVMALVLSTHPELLNPLLAVPPATEPPPPPTTLFEAVAEGTRDDTRRLLDAGAPLGQRRPDGATVLMWAVGDQEQVRLLLDRGADPAASAKDGVTPLWIAAGYDGTRELVRELIARGADVNTRGHNGMTPLMRAGTGGADLEKAGLLLDAAADVNAADEFGPALQWPIAVWDTEMVRLFLDRGANLDAQDPAGRSALMYCALDGARELTALLLARGARLELRDTEGLTALHWAAMVDWGHTGVLQALLAAGANPSAASPDGRTPLALARHYRNTAALTLLEQALASSTGTGERE